MLAIPGWEPQRLNVSNNLSLRYVQIGEGPPLILLHTLRTQLEYFRDLAPLLAKSYTVYAVDLPAFGYSSIDLSAPMDEPYFRNAIVSFLQMLDLHDVTMVGESIGAVLALTVSAEVPERVRKVYALNTYDYDTRFGDGVRRGNWFANFIVGGLGIPVFGPVAGSLEDRFILGQILRGGFADPKKLPPDLLTEFSEVSRQPNYRRSARKVFLQWRSWPKARELYSSVKASVTLIYGDKDWSRLPDRERTKSALKSARVFTLKNSGHFSAVENPNAVADIILS